MYLFVNDPYEAKYQLLIMGLKCFNDSQDNDMDDIYKNIKEHNPNKKHKTLIVFDDMIADMLNYKKLNPIVTELFIKGRKLIISLVFITQSYFALPKNSRLNPTHYFKSHLIIHQILTLVAL